MNLKLIKKYFDPIRVLDIGANVGQFYNEFKSEYPFSDIYLIEASNECEPHLKSLTSNYYIEILSDEIKPIIFYKTKNSLINTGDSIYRELTPYYSDNVLIKERRISNTLDNLNLGVFDLIKIDTQGSELDIIKGGLDTCSKSKGLLLEVSVIPYNDGSPLKDAVIDYLKTINFELVEILFDNTFNNYRSSNGYIIC